MLGDQRRQLVVALGVELDRRPRRRRVGGGSPVGELGAVGDLAGERVAEGEDPLRVELRFVEEAGLGQLAEHRVDLVRLEPGGHPQRSRAELLADHRGDLQQLLGVGVEPVDAGGEDRLHGDRHTRVLDRAHQAVGAALALEVAGLGQLADDLLDEERVALGALVDRLVEPVQRGVLAGQVAQQLAGVLARQRLQGDLVGRSPSAARGACTRAGS